MKFALCVVAYNYHQNSIMCNINVCLFVWFVFVCAVTMALNSL